MMQFTYTVFTFTNRGKIIYLWYFLSLNDTNEKDNKFQIKILFSKNKTARFLIK